MDTKTITIDGNTIEYYHTTGKNETLVLVNGSGGPIFGWFKIIDALAFNYNVLAYNRPGIGKSTKPTTPQTFLQSANDLKALLTQLQINEKIVLVGHSLGGLIAQQFSISYPEKVTSLILLEPSTVWDILENDKLPIDKNVSNSELNYVKSSAMQLEKIKSFPSIPVTICMGIKKSLLSIIFQKQFVSRQNNLKRLSMHIKDAKLIAFEKSGHFPQMTEPKKVVQVILSSTGQKD